MHKGIRRYSKLPGSGDSAGDANPWCLCQDVPYDTPVPWEFVEVESFDSQTYRWKWGRLKEGTHPGSAILNLPASFKVLGKMGYRWLIDNR